MDEILQKAFVNGVERVAAWADLLDSINVYPIADGDTGRNLFVSLTPLLTGNQEKEIIIRQLLLAARGNSGNIASRFFSAFYRVDSWQDLHGCAQEGRDRAWKAVHDPLPGTMLTVFDTLVEALTPQTTISDPEAINYIISRLEKSVHDTCEMLPKLKKAGVVDAGALGMYIFFEGFFYSMAGTKHEYRPITELFKNRLHISPAFQEEAETGYCVDFVIKAQNLSAEKLAIITKEQESVIVIPEGDLYKIHLHTDNREKIKDEVAKFGSMVNWEDDNLNQQINELRNAQSNQELHIMTDAAASLTRSDAKNNGITLLHSYITMGEKCLPETHFHPAELYAAMRRGIKVSTSQASIFERHQFYESIMDRFEKALYLCVGSIYTGNYSTAVEWKKQHDPQNRLAVIDTGAASGRLAVIVLATSRYLNKTNDVGKTIIFATKAVQVCEEYVFLDKLEYLAAGGRLSKTSAFFGDMLKMKPVISPQPEGAKKVGVVRNQEDQIKMAMARLAASLTKDAKTLIMLEYSDNCDFVNNTVQPLIAAVYPHAEIIIQPLSLTSGAHMGPGDLGSGLLAQHGMIMSDISEKTLSSGINKKGRFAFVIPVYNHAGTVANVVRRTQALGFPVFVVNDGSTDNTRDAIKDIKDIRIIDHKKNMGKGAALISGFAAAAVEADWAITIDADGQHYPEDAPKLIAAIPQGARAIVVGAREGMIGKHVPWTSRFGRKFSNFWVWMSGGPVLSDSQSGMRLYPLPEAIVLPVKARRFQFEVEILVLAKRKGLPVWEAPVRVVYNPGGARISHFRPFVDFVRNSTTFTRLIFTRIFPWR